MVSRTTATTDRRRSAAAAVLFALLGAGQALGADAPTKEEWDPVKAAIDANQPDAERQLAALVARFPAWPSGQRELAKQRLRHGEVADALASAEAALKLDPTEVEAACVQVQALAAAGRPSDAYAALDAFAGKDKGGWLHYHGARVALDAKDLPRAERMLKEAREKAVNSAPPEFAFLESRLARAKGDKDAARAALMQATQSNDKLYEGWYELGRVELELAGERPEQAKDLVEAANSHFERALKGRAEDPSTLYGVGYARYERAKLLLEAQDEDGGQAGLRDAIAVLDQALAKQPDFALAHYVLGNVLVQLGRFADAIPHLRRAEQLGVTDRAAQYNLALALESTGDHAGSEAILAKNQAVTPSEQIQVALGAYHGHEFGLASELLAAVAPKLEGDAERQGAVYRFLGHALRQLAEQAAKSTAAAGDDEARAPLAKRAEQLTDQAARAYAASGDLKDRKAQDHYLATETARSPELGYAAGWRYLAWKGYVSPAGWTAVVGNYGGWLSGGGGIKGAWMRHPAHVAVWGALAGLPLLFFLKALFTRRGSSSSSPSSESPRRPPTESTRSRPTPAAAAAAKPAPRETPVTGNRVLGGHGRATAAAAPATQKRETEATARPRSAQKAETEEMDGPVAGNPGETSPALVRKTPRKR